MNPTSHYVTGSRSSSSFDCFSQGASLFVSVFQLYVNILIIKSLFNSSSIVASFKYRPFTGHIVFAVFPKTKVKCDF